MADDKSSSGTGKRPYATLDLRATEIKVTPIAGKAQNAAASAAADSGPSNPPSSSDASVPLPAPARSYAVSAKAYSEPQSEIRMQADQTKSEKATRASSSAGSAAAFSAASASHDADTDVVTPKRGGFFSHLAAGIVGGSLVILATQWALPQFGLQGASGSAEDTAVVSDRLASLETSVARNARATDLTALEGRIAGLEKVAQTIPALTDGQKRLVAETKAALASAASDTGSTQLIERLGKVEDKLKALADAGANDPNSGRVEQLAALTGKVADLETSLSTQLTELRTNVAKDVEGRVQAATEASEAARAGTQRLDKDIAGVKGDTAGLAGRIQAATDTSDHVAADLKVAKEETAGLKAAFEGLKTSAAKPADIAAAIAPVADRTAALEKSVEQVVQADAARKEDAGRVVLALELQNLRRALDSGQKFSSQLDDVKKVAGQKVDLSALTRLQDTGVPSLADLTKEFRTAADNAIDADTEPENESVVDRLWAGAKSVVRVRRVDLKPDDKSTEAIVGRMQVALNDGRLADVLEASKDLSPKAQDAARPFLDKVAARVSVDTALAGLETQLKSSLAAGSQPAPQAQ